MVCGVFSILHTYTCLYCLVTYDYMRLRCEIDDDGDDQVDDICHSLTRIYVKSYISVSRCAFKLYPYADIDHCTCVFCARSQREGYRQ